MVRFLFFRKIGLALTLLISEPASAMVPHWIDRLAEKSQIQNDDPDTRRDITCMALAIYFEARGESHKGQVAVGEVIMNRTRSPKYPSSACGVLLQRGQFSFMRRGEIRPMVETQWRDSIDIAAKVRQGSNEVIGRQLSFCQHRLRNSGLVIGGHTFY
jgi:hypothetical protein